MIDELNEALGAYQKKWQTFIASRKAKDFFTTQQPTAVAWKFEDAEALNKAASELQTLCDQVTMHLKDIKLDGGIQVVKLMQRRPGSDDALGLDHLDFYSTQNNEAKAVLSAESDLKWTEENNGEHCTWLSIWLNGGEAKLRTDTVMKVCAEEMLELDAKLVQLS
jgi:hypothetical protein